MPRAKTSTSSSVEEKSLSDLIGRPPIDTQAVPQVDDSPLSNGDITDKHKIFPLI